MRYGIIANVQRETPLSLLHEFLRILVDHGCDFVLNSDVEAKVGRADWRSALRYMDRAAMVDSVDLLVSFGGDGTLLSVAQLVGEREKPILGVNVGKLGFLTEVEMGEFSRVLPRLRAGQFDLEQRMVLTARWGNDGHAMALNEVAVVKQEVGRVIRIAATVDQYFLNTYTADGLIVATPTGSTGYSLSSNGPIVSPTMHAFIINPISPHTLMARPLVIPSDQEVTLRLEKGYHGILTADGQEVAEVDSATDVIIGKARHKVQLVRLGARTYFEVLRTKLRWGEDVRNEGP